jgi:hypothetical protein
MLPAYHNARATETAPGGAIDTKTSQNEIKDSVLEMHETVTFYRAISSTRW